MTEPCTVSIVVLTYNRRQCLEDLLIHLRQVLPSVLEIIVVDNASDDDTDTLVRSRFPEYQYIRNKENLGACGRNSGMVATKGDVVITLDDDIYGLEAQSLREIVNAFADDPLLSALNFRVVDFKNGHLCNWVHHCSPALAKESFPTYEITEGAVAFRTSALRQVGYYWEPFFIGHEGLDLALRLLDAGFSVRYVGTIVVRHKHESQSRADWRFYYYDTRNQIWVAARRMRLRWAARYLSIGLGAMAVYAMRDRHFWWWLRGLAHGMRGLPAAVRTRRPMRPDTEETIRMIDRGRPRFWTQVKKRMFQAANRLEE